MKLPRVSTFPIDKPFERQPATMPLSQIALRLVVNFYSDQPYVIGTATVLAGHLLVSARHVLDLAVSRDDSRKPHGIESSNHLVAVQLFPGPEILVWDVVQSWADPVSDIALLHLGNNPGKSHPEKNYQWQAPRVNAFPPNEGERIAAFGYRKSNLRLSRNNQGGNHIDLDDEPMMSVGVVRHIHEIRRDLHQLPFPCYQVSARFDAGMSGGPVFDEAGSLCGLICSNIHGSHLHGEPVSFVTTLWPLFRIIIGADRGVQYPRGITYPAIELARGTQIRVADLARLDAWFSKHVTSQPDVGSPT